jgi:hypothetical protein
LNLIEENLRESLKEKVKDLTLLIFYNLLRYIYARGESKHPKMGGYNKDSWSEPYEITPGEVKRAYHLERVLFFLKSFTDSNIYYQKYSKFDKVNFYRESLFQIMPPVSFDIGEEVSSNAQMAR